MTTGLNRQNGAQLAAVRPSRRALTLFAFGDFAFNLFWQSVMLYLLFYYTDTLGIPVALSAAVYTIASLWDGFAGFAVGALIDRRGTEKTYRTTLVFGGPLLGLAFALVYFPINPNAPFGIAAVIGVHMLFRSAYALVNVPYLAMSARISSNSRDRAYVAGIRMLSGTMAAVVVASATMPLGATLLGPTVTAYFGSAMVFAAVGSAILVVVGRRFHDGVLTPRRSAPIGAAFAALAANRAFMTLAGAMVTMIIGSTILNKSVLYYFKYIIGDERSGQLALAMMMAVSGAAVPLWMVVARLIGTRRVWFIAAGLCIMLLILLSAIDIVEAGAMQLFLAALQVAIVGLNYVVWAMLPDTIEYGERANGVRVEATMFGLVALLQRFAIGIATAVFGWSFSQAGYAANTHLSVATIDGLRGAITVLPIGFFSLSAIFMALNPLRPGVHDAIARELAA